ncbi:hypothetical protein NA56DRAFT_133394 [Hyaloscypha hepaticicola]|uniref:Uncharacterized protein n=1 Tax=Hyaloscypha hepaticicola TaxID=2082293 RepID=A0A2J6Q4Q2_9HELO|nr:hypothetical protein NA56DRAFT_133394 [Hyaloscypha hepaticicola]
MGVLGENWWWVWAVAAKMVFLGGKNEVSADFSVNFQKSAYIAYDCMRRKPSSPSYISPVTRPQSGFCFSTTTPLCHVVGIPLEPPNITAVKPR